MVIVHSFISCYYVCTCYLIIRDSAAWEFIIWGIYKTRALSNEYATDDNLQWNDEIILQFISYPHGNLSVHMLCNS